MKITWRLKEVMAEKGINSNRLQELTGFHRGTVSKLRHNLPARLDMGTLEKLCNALECKPGDIIGYE